MTIGYGVKTIGNSAFADCKFLEYINIPSSVNDFGNLVFDGCPIKSATIPSLAIEYLGKEVLEHVVINAGVNIGNDAFNYCDSLISITLPASISKIGDYAFNGCTSLEAVYISDIEAWCKISFGSGLTNSNPLAYAHNLYLDGKLLTELIIPNGITEIKNAAFDGCKSIVSVIISDSVTSIGYGAFRDCSNLESINIPENITIIGDSAFEGCASLLNINLPDSIKSIGDRTFKDNYSLHSITLPNDITEISDYMFYNCRALELISIPTNVVSIGDYSFYNCEKLDNISIPDGVKSIGEYVLYGCKSLRAIRVPFIGSIVDDQNDAYFGYIFGADSWKDNVAYIPVSLKKVIIAHDNNVIDRAFYGCNSIEVISIYNGVETIGYEAFYECSSLTSIELPSSVTIIGISAFSFCRNLNNIEMPINLIYIESGAFSYCTSLLYF